MTLTRVEVERSAEEDVVTLEVEVGQDDLKEAQAEVYRDLSREVNVPGFRKGKVPPFILKQRLGSEMIQRFIADRVVPDAYREAIKQTDTEPVDEAKIEVVEAEEGKPLVFKATVAVRPELELGNYRGIPAERRVREVAEREIDEVVFGLRQRAAEWVNAPADHMAKDGDRLVGKLTIRVDGKVPEDGQDRDLDLLLWRGQIQPPIDADLEGIKAGETRTFPVQYPLNFGEESLAGKEAEFEVVVEQIQVEQLPEANDELPAVLRANRDKTIAEVKERLRQLREESRQPVLEDDEDEDRPESLLDGIESLAELRDGIRERIAERNRREADSELEEEVIAVAVGRVSVPVPPSMLAREVDSRMDSLRQRLESRGIDFEDYLVATGRSEDELRKEHEPEAERYLRRIMVLDEIAKVESLEATEEDVEERLTEMAEALGSPVALLRDHLEENEGLEGVKRSVLRRKAAQLLVEHAEIEEVSVPAEEDEETVTEDETAEISETAVEEPADEGETSAADLTGAPAVNAEDDELEEEV